MDSASEQAKRARCTELSAGDVRVMHLADASDVLHARGSCMLWVSALMCVQIVRAYLNLRDVRTRSLGEEISGFRGSEVGRQLLRHGTHVKEVQLCCAPHAHVTG